jgi:hypothetical protein
MLGVSVVTVMPFVSFVFVFVFTGPGPVGSVSVATVSCFTTTANVPLIDAIPTIPTWSALAAYSKVTLDQLKATADEI